MARKTNPMAKPTPTPTHREYHEAQMAQANAHLSRMDALGVAFDEACAAAMADGREIGNDEAVRDAHNALEDERKWTTRKQPGDGVFAW